MLENTGVSSQIKNFTSKNEPSSLALNSFCMPAFTVSEGQKARALNATNIQRFSAIKKFLSHPLKENEVLRVFSFPGDFLQVDYKVRDAGCPLKKIVLRAVDIAAFHRLEV